MKDKSLKIALVVAIAAVTGYGIYTNQTEVTMSDVMLENVEALARYEGGDGMTDCPNGCLAKSGVCFCRGFQPYEEKYWGD